MGVPNLPAAVAGRADSFAVSRLRNVKLVVKQADVPIAAWQDGFGELVSGPRGDVSRPIGTALRGVADLGRVSSGDAVEAGYPAGALGGALHDVARLVRADAGLRVATVDFGGWDLHAGAGRAGDGPMHDNLLELSRALAAFGAELDDDFGRVTLVTLTEFGRRAAENGSGGTDHGVAGAALVLGGAVRGARPRPVAGPGRRPARGRRPRGHHRPPVDPRRGPRHPARRDRPARGVPRLHAEGRRRGASALRTHRRGAYQSFAASALAAVDPAWRRRD